MHTGFKGPGGDGVSTTVPMLSNGKMSLSDSAKVSSLNSGGLGSFLSSTASSTVRSTTTLVSCLTCSLRSSMTSTGKSVCTATSDVCLESAVACLSHWMVASFVDFFSFALLRHCCFKWALCSFCSAKNIANC